MSYRSSHGPLLLIDAWGSDSLYIELDPQRIAKGGSIDIPSEGAKAYLHSMSGASRGDYLDVYGVIRIVDMSDADISVDFALKAKNVRWWTKSGTEIFRYAKRSCEGKADWLCEYYTK